jgi:hypothetical protein
MLSSQGRLTGRADVTMQRVQHKYMGETIIPTNWDGKRWYVQAYHHTGIPYGEQDCRHFYTLNEAKEAIREDKRCV